MSIAVQLARFRQRQTDGQRPQISNLNGCRDRPDGRAEAPWDFPAAM